MVYKDNFVTAVKVGGKVLREKGEKVYLPFGSEYSLFLKNLDSRRVLLDISIDGEKISGNGLVLNALQSVDLERSIQNGNLWEGNKFKFIERTAAVEEGRGVRAEDGLVRVEVKREQIWQPRLVHYTFGSLTPWQSSLQSQQVVNSTLTSHGSAAATPAVLRTACLNDVGITVPGSHSDQSFSSVGWFPTEYDTKVIVLHLVGYNQGKKVSQPRTVDLKPQCVTCKKVNKVFSKFCSRCGTSLEIV